MATARAGSFSSDLWYWPHHRVYFRFDGSVIKEDRKIIREVMADIEDNTCVTFVETQRRRYKYLTISTDKSYNCIYCYYLGLVCPLKNGGAVRSSPFCTKGNNFINIFLSIFRYFTVSNSSNIKFHNGNYLLHNERKIMQTFNCLMPSPLKFY